MSVGFQIELPHIGQALFTTRAAGNLSLRAGVAHQHGLQARERLCRSLRLRWLCASPQVHGTRVRRVRGIQGCGGTPLPDAADGQATATKGVGAMVLVADCVPIVIAAPHAVAAVHAGWRGLASGVVEEGVTAVLELAGAGAAGELVAIIGPCAGPCCYVVGEEVHAAFGQAPHGVVGLDAHPLHPSSRPAPRPLDLRWHARARLVAAGVERIQDVEVCTICDTRMFSHRREGVDAGRQAAIAWLT